MASWVITNGDGNFSAQAMEGVRDKMIHHYCTPSYLLTDGTLHIVISLSLSSSAKKHTFISQFNIFKVEMHAIIDDMPLFNWKYFFLNW